MDRKRLGAGLFIVLFLGISGWACSQPPGSTAGKAEAAEAPAVQRLGYTLAGAEQVSVRDLLKDPMVYQGKVVRVSGVIKDWCYHRRAWFGIADEEGRGMVRVFTLPRFEAPADCLGKQAVAEGKVEILTIDPEQAGHYRKDHKFLSGVEGKPGEPIPTPIVRAFGAEFR